MKVRYTSDELARFSEEELVRREFDERNLTWLSTALVILLFFGLVVLWIGNGDDNFTDTDRATLALKTVVNSVALLIVALVRRRPRAHYVVAGVILTCVIGEYVLTLYPLEPGVWLKGALLPFLFCRFRLPEKQIYALHVFYLATAAVTAYLAPLAAAEFAHPPIRYGLFIAIVSGLFVAFVVSAMVLQLAGTRRVRRELLDEWREPLREAREQLRMRDELHYAREMQLAMLPEAPPRLDWLDIAATSIPAAEVGGDYYDFFAGDGRIAIVACDVAGHGMASGLVLAAMRGGFTMLRRSMRSPAAVLEQLHDLVLHTSRQRLLATAAVVMLDRDSCRATIASAGHPPILIRRAGRVSSVELYAAPLGIRLPVTMTERTFDLAKGDLLVLHSDGIYEARNEAGETYGLERLLRVVESVEERATAAASRDVVLRDLESFRGAAPQDDDVTIVVAKLI